MKPMTRLAVMSAVLLASTGGAIASQAPPPAVDLARRIQAHYDGVRTFTADFTQTYGGGPLNVPAIERGSLKVKKPGRFRMDYTKPHRKTFVADSVMFYSYFPEDETGTRARLPEDSQASTALQFIAGQGNLLRDFTPNVAANQPEAEWHLELLPKRGQTEFEVLTLMVDRRTMSLVGFGWLDNQGGTTVTRFTNLRENATIADREFDFRFPPGVIIR